MFKFTKLFEFTKFFEFTKLFEKYFTVSYKKKEKGFTDSIDYMHYP